MTSSRQALGLAAWLLVAFAAAAVGGVAFAEVLVLWVLIAATLAAFRRVRPLAAALLIPYLLWVSFAAALTFAVWRLNPRLLA